MPSIPFLDIHVSHTCNFQCQSCAHFSGGSRGLVDLNDAEAWMNAWRNRLQPGVFGLLGGEPTLHPQLIDFILLVIGVGASVVSKMILLQGTQRTQR